MTPTDGRLEYPEGIHVGYRAWLKADRTPAYPFGYGLGYTTWSFERSSSRMPRTAAPGHPCQVTPSCA